MKGFRDFFENLNLRLQTGAGSLTRSPITAEVIQVIEENTFLEPVSEIAEVQRMINSHNTIQHDQAVSKVRSRLNTFFIKRLVLFTGYLVSQSDSQRLIHDLLIPTLPDGISEASDMKYMANSIMIKPGPTPRPVLQPILNRIGGMGKRLSWQVTGIAAFENKVWAARVAPVSSKEPFYADKNQPMVVLAVRKHGRPGDAIQIQNWLPVPADKALIFDTVIDEKVVLRICNQMDDTEFQNDTSVNKGQKRRFQQGQDEDVVYPQSGVNFSHDGPHHHPHQRPGGDNRQHHDDGPRRGNFRGRGRGGRGRGMSNRGGRGRGRGGRDGGSNPWYKSLDDTNHTDDTTRHEKGGNGAGQYAMDY